MSTAAHPIRAYLEALAKQCRCMAEVLERRDKEIKLRLNWTTDKPKPKGLSEGGWSDWTCPSPRSEMEEEAIRLFAEAKAATIDLPADVRGEWSGWLNNTQAAHMALLGDEDEKNFSRRSVYPVQHHAKVVDGLLRVWNALETSIRENTGRRKAGNGGAKQLDTKGKRVKGKHINARIMEMLQQTPDSVGWSARKWAAHLACSASTVSDSPAWRTIKKARALHAADSGTNREKENGSDGRRRSKRRSVDD